MRSVLAITASMLACSLPAFGQSLEGVWRPVEIVINGGPNPGRHTSDIQPGLAIFTKRHYSQVWVVGFSPRPRLSDSPTDEERGRVFQPFGANAGTYELRDSTLTLAPIVAKNPAVMAGTPLTVQVRLQGDSVWVTTRSADGSVTRAKWVRTERL